MAVSTVRILSRNSDKGVLYLRSYSYFWILECSGLLLDETVSMSMESESNISSTKKSSFIVRLASPPTGKKVLD